MSKRVCEEERIRLIMECRKSGLSYYQWCEHNGIHPGNGINRTEIHIQSESLIISEIPVGALSKQGYVR